jgi:hypothetical protein
MTLSRISSLQSASFRVAYAKMASFLHFGFLSLFLRASASLRQRKPSNPGRRNWLRSANPTPNLRAIALLNSLIPSRLRENGFVFSKSCPLDAPPPAHAPHPPHAQAPQESRGGEEAVETARSAQASVQVGFVFSKVPRARQPRTHIAPRPRGATRKGSLLAPSTSLTSDSQVPQGLRRPRRRGAPEQRTKIPRIIQSKAGI